MNPFKQITILLADDHEPVRQGLRTLLSEDAQMRIVGEARNGREAVDMARRLRPAVILMDISMPIINGLEATVQILAERSSTRIIILSAHNDEEYVERTRAVGAVGFVAKQMFADTLTWVIHEVAMGRTLSNPVINAGTARGKNKADPGNGAAKDKRWPLNSRESELLLLVAEGSLKRQMAAKLRISVATVDRRLESLVAKLGVRCVANLADYAIASGYTESDVFLTIT